MRVLGIESIRVTGSNRTRGDKFRKVAKLSERNFPQERSVHLFQVSAGLCDPRIRGYEQRPFVVSGRVFSRLSRIAQSVGGNRSSGLTDYVSHRDVASRRNSGKRSERRKSCLGGDRRDTGGINGASRSVAFSQRVARYEKAASLGVCRRFDELGPNRRLRRPRRRLRPRRQQPVEPVDLPRDSAVFLSLLM